MATTKLQTPLNLLKASNRLNHLLSQRPTLTAAIANAPTHTRQSSTSTTTTSSSSSPATSTSGNALSWNDFLTLRRQRRFINLGSSAISGVSSIAVAIPIFSANEIENIGAQMTGMDPMFIIGGSLMGVGAVGWLLGPFLGTAVFNIWRGSVREEFARKDKDFYAHIKRFRADPASSSVNNPVPDYYGEKINSVADYRRWLKDQRAFTRKKNKNLL